MSRQFSSTKIVRARAVVTLAFAIGLALFFASTPPLSSTAPAKPTQSLSQKRTRPEFIPGEILVRYRDDRTAELKARSPRLFVRGRQVAMELERRRASDVVRGLRLARVAPEDTLAAIDALNKQPDVLYAEPNYILRTNLNPNDTHFTNNNLYGLVKINAPGAWNTLTGSSAIVVGVIDEGIDVTHSDLSANIWTNPAETAGNGIDDDGNGFTDDVNGFNFANNTGSIPGDSHATHVAGTIGAVGNNGSGVVGVNWTVRLMTLKFIAGGSGATSDAVDACAYAVMMKNLFASSGGTKGANIHVLNNSYGGGGFSQSFLDVINSLNSVGILFAAAAGNVDSGTLEPNNEIVPHYPSGYEAPNVISVAATTSSDALWASSHFGSLSVDLGAPGVGIISTTPGNSYSFFTGTSMATPHVAGAAALLRAHNQNLTVAKIKNLLLLNGDVQPSLVDKTLSGRRLNVNSSFSALAENDTTAPGSVTNFLANSQTGRSFNVGWTASGDDGAAGQASLYLISFVDSTTGSELVLKGVLPAVSGAPQTADVKVPYRHRKGSIRLRAFDNAGNEGVPANINVSLSFADADPYAMTLGVPAALTTGGTPLNLIGDDVLKRNQPLGITFPFFGQNVTTAHVSSNGNLFFSEPPTRSTPTDADDVPSSTVDLSRFKIISGMWDDIRTDRRAGDDVYMVSPDPSRVIFRWSAVTFGNGLPESEFPVNFEIELRTDGTILSRYGVGQSAPINTNLFPVVGISGGEPDAYVVQSHTSENSLTNLTNAMEVIYLPRGVNNPLDNPNFFVVQHYDDFFGRVPDVGGLGFWINEITSCGNNAGCIEVKRINVSAAFYVSIEFQETGFLVYRMYKSAFGMIPGAPVPVRFEELMPDTRVIGQGVIVGAPGWELQLEANKVAFANAFVQRSRFTNAYPTSMTPAAFVDELFANAGITPSASDRTAAINEFGGAGNTADTAARGRALRLVSENDLLEALENSRAFVLMQYFGYLRRNPYDPPELTLDYAGYNFWLNKLNQFNGNYIAAEMVKAFIDSTEYRQRFGP